MRCGYCVLSIVRVLAGSRPRPTLLATWLVVLGCAGGRACARRRLVLF